MSLDIAPLRARGSAAHSSLEGTMADAGLYIGGAPVRGRVGKGLVVFNDARRWYQDAVVEPA